MRNPLSFLNPRRLGALTVLAVCLFGLPLSSFLPAHMTALGRPLGGHPVSMFEDWSTRHVAYARYGPMLAMQAAARDPRAGMSWWGALQAGVNDSGPVDDAARLRGRGAWGRPRVHHDWAINLGTAGTANGMYPAKFTFDVTATPSCANDYIVFPVAANGSSTQPNIVAFNNLYSGTAGANGFCNRTATASDTGVAATVLWSYNVQAISGGGAVTTSPVIAYDPLGGSVTGTTVAFVESAAGSPAHFHVLAPKNGDGQNSGNLQSVLSPKTVNTFVSNAPAAASGTSTDLSLGSSTSGTVTLSSPFVDYVRDLAYVGNDLGVLYRIKNVFCTSVNPNCSGGSKPAPSLDASFGSGGSVTVCSGQLTGPVMDFVTLNIYVGCSDGKLYSISQTGTVNGSLVVGDGVASKTYGAIVDPPIVDGVNGFVYVSSGSASNGANGVLVQANMALSSSVAVPIGAGNQCNLHAPALSNGYFTSPTGANSLIYIGGATGTVGPCTALGATGGNLVIYGATFKAGGVLNSGAPAHNFTAGNPGNEFAPMAEFYNANAGTGTDYLFFSAMCTGADMDALNITTGWSTSFLVTPVVSGFGTSGMIVDNYAKTTAGNYPQASSIYFNALGENAACTGNTGTNTTPGANGCAVKLTQAALN